jgi:hypothetical protein
MEERIMHSTVRRIHRIACLSILVALAVWAQSKQAGPKIQAVVCPPQLVVGAMATCTVTLNKAAPKGGVVIVTNSKPSVLVTTSPVTVPEGKTSVSFQIKVSGM